MEDILLELETKPQEAIKKLTVSEKKKEDIDNYIKEYKEGDRKIRDSQVGNIQKDKTVGEGEKAKLVKAIRSIVPFQKKIVNTACAFEVGKPVTLLTDQTNELFETVINLWDKIRIDDKIQKAKVIQKSQTEVAFEFYIKEAQESQNIFSKIKNAITGKTAKKEIKVKLLENENGNMSPYFDEQGDMTAFTWTFQTKVGDKTVNNTWVWTKELLYKCSDEAGSFVFVDKLPHGFGKIPIVYIEQDTPEWDDVKTLIDRYETALSKLGASNDYSGYPLLKLYGKIENMPDRNDDGKTLTFPMKEMDNETGKTIHGDAEFLTSTQASENVKLEMETLESLIYALSSTPNLSFDNLKGSVGNISGIALKLLFLDSMIKASMNEGDNRTMIQRIINVLISGITKTVNTSFDSKVKDTFIKIKFNSILPDDLKEAVDIISAAKGAGIISLDTAVNQLDIAEDSETEIAAIKKEATEVVKKPIEPVKKEE